MRARSKIIVLAVAFGLASCAPGRITLPSEVRTPAPASITLPGTRAASPVATPAPTTAARLERWQQYENALAAVYLPTPYLPGKGFCEWEILGHAPREVYVWAECQVADSVEGAAMSAPAVVYLSESGDIENVKVPRDGSLYGPDIRSMFPQDVQQKIFSRAIDLDGMWAHLQSRHENPEPPLIAESGAVLP